MKESAQAQADALVGVLEHLSSVEDSDDTGGTLPYYVLDSGQKAFISSLAMAKALETLGVGLDPLEFKEFGSKFKDWIEPGDASLTQRGDDLWLGCGGYFESIYLDESYNPKAPISLMMRIADAIDEGPVPSIAKNVNIGKAKPKTSKAK
jgi:hypothetical protein